MEPRWSTRNDEDSICISHAGLVEGFSCLLVDFGNWIFPFCFFYTFRSTAEKLLQWWHWTFLWTSENRKRNMERIFFSRFTSKQFFGEWSSDLHDVNIWYQDYKHIRGWDFFKALFSTFLKEAEKNSASFFVSQNRRISFISNSLTTHKARFAQLKSLFLQLSMAIQAFEICQPATWPRKHHFDSLAQKTLQTTMAWEIRSRNDIDMVQWPFNSASTSKCKSVLAEWRFEWPIRWQKKECPT